MQHVVLGTSGLRLSRIVMGTWQAGKRYWVGVTDTEVTRAIHASLDEGVNAFDTAEEYGDGESERVLGAALAGRRDEALLLSKVFSNHLAYDQVIAACERSLKNLGTDHLDLYQIHWPAGSWGSEAVPLSETLGAMTDLKTQGKIRALGVSNFSRVQLEEARQHAVLDSVQPPYSLFWRGVEHEVLPYCVTHGLTVLAYSPLAQGLLTGRFGPGHTFAKGDHRHANKLFSEPHLARALAALEQLRPIAADAGVTVGQLALAWLIAQPQAVAVVGARNAQQARQNAQAGAVQLPAEVVARVGEIGMQVAGAFADDPVPWHWNV